MPAYPIALDLPQATQDIVKETAQAIREEHRNSSHWKRLQCRGVKPLSDSSDETLFVIELGQSVEFDWSWEGAIAFRPRNINTFDGVDVSNQNDFLATVTDGASSTVWVGEVVQVDEAAGQIFVSIPDPEHPPHVGQFYIRPFQFLECLHSIYCDDGFDPIQKLLPERLEASRVVPSSMSEGSESELQELWQHPWAILWGPPGTGKTYTLGKQVADRLNDPAERILIVSTTNKATDEAAISIGRAARAIIPNSLEDGRILRVGKGADYARFQRERLGDLLKDTESEVFQKISEVKKQLDKADSPAEKAPYQAKLQALRRMMKDMAFRIFFSEKAKVVVSTAFKAVSLLNDPALRISIAGGDAPFTTVIIDEAGLISRAATAALSLLAARRVLIVGDPKQLAPISKISRVIPPAQATWIARSALSHLQQIDSSNKAVCLLREQHRMHPDIRKAVSEYQYEGRLEDSPTVINREAHLPLIFQDQPRAIWYVLDEDPSLELPAIRAKRGSGNRSWVREATKKVLEKLFKDPSIGQQQGLYLSPFKAQAKETARFLKDWPNWSASTIHSQQGAEADIVIFDTVNAGSTGWSYEDWKRLVNVGISRAKQCVLLLTSRAEMNQPYLYSLSQNLAPRILNKDGGSYALAEVSPPPLAAIADVKEDKSDLVGNQLILRKRLRPVLSAAQQRLIGLKMDGKPRLVRGVAGSGKTVVLAHWLAQTMKKLSDTPNAKVWAVYANKSLDGLLKKTINEAWSQEGTPFPWDKVEVLHIIDILQPLLKAVKLKIASFNYDYDWASESYLREKPFEEIASLCDAMFIDEAQDMGPHTLELLSALVKQTDNDDPKSRAIHIFYDNAQNIYGRATPKWSDIGLDLRGRSAVMEESFRSTKQITELALNTLYCLQPLDKDSDHKELIERGLIEKTTCNNTEWWDVRFNQVSGPLPDFKTFVTETQEIDAIGDQVVRLIRDEAVKPEDICIISNTKDLANTIANCLAPKLRVVNATIVSQTNQAFIRGERTVIVTTPHSFKGYDSEIVIIAGIDRFVALGKGILANNLYVAMTRARSILMMYAQNAIDGNAASLLSVVKRCRDTLLECSEMPSALDDTADILELIGDEHQGWLKGLWQKHDIQQEPIIAEDGEVLATPIFWFEDGLQKFACFGFAKLGQATCYKLEDAGIKIMKLGED